MNNKKMKPNLVLLLPSGRLHPELLREVHRLAEQYSLGIYLTTAQNLRLTDIPEGKVDEIKTVLAELGATFKGPGKFPIPRVCLGNSYCNLGTVDTAALSDRILSAYGNREKTKAKFKIAISGCPLGCSNPKLTDMGIVGTRKGFEFYVGGKGGANPKIGMRIGKEMSEEQVIDMIGRLVEFHDLKTEKKQRFAKLQRLPDFPFPEV